jgi:hypothetical protein
MRTVMLLFVPALLSCGGASDTKQDNAADTTGAAASVDSTWTGPKACELVATADIKRVTAVEVKAGVTTNDYAGDSQCRFDRVSVDSAYVMVTLHAHGNIEPYRKVPGSVEVSRVGDDAIWSETNGQLALRHGDAVFSISFLSSPARKQWAVELARVALAKLEGV